MNKVYWLDLMSCRLVKLPCEGWLRYIDLMSCRLVKLSCEGWLRYIDLMSCRLVKLPCEGWLRYIDLMSCRLVKLSCEGWIRYIDLTWWAAGFDLFESLLHTANVMISFQPSFSCQETFVVGFFSFTWSLFKCLCEILNAKLSPKRRNADRDQNPRKLWRWGTCT